MPQSSFRLHRAPRNPGCTTKGGGGKGGAAAVSRAPFMRPTQLHHLPMAGPHDLCPMPSLGAAYIRL